MSAPDLQTLAGRQALLAQFDCLIGQIGTAAVLGPNFRRWEMDILLDVEASGLHGPDLRAALIGYQEESGPRLVAGDMPLRFSQYLEETNDTLA